MKNPIFPITIWSHDKHIQAIPRPSPKRALSLQLFCEGIQSSRVALLPSTFTTRPVVAFIANETNGATRLINISDDDVKTKQPSSSNVRKAVSQLRCTERFTVSRIAVRDVLL
jgi:hypothetical protein